jgi:hypothetical protein
VIDFNPAQWHHGYLGLFLVVLSMLFNKGKTKNWILGIGLFIVADEITQIFIFGQYGGLLHWLYSFIYKIGIVREINYFFDGLFKT